MKNLSLFTVMFLCLLTLLLKPETLNAQTYEVSFDSANASGWFGGDNRTNIGPRNIGVGQSVLIDTSITLNSFAFNFTGRFDFPQTPDGHGHEVTLTLNVRNSVGIILRTLQNVVPDTFAGGWITWENINLDIDEDSTVIFTTYLVGAFTTNQYFNGHISDQFASYEGGVRYTKGGTSDADMEDWTDWGRHSWDSAFMLQGTIKGVTSIKEGDSELPDIYTLSQNYPNPFNPETTIAYTLQKDGPMEIRIFNARGQAVRTLVHKNENAGQHSVVWNGRDEAGGAVPSGAYFYRITTAGFQSTKKMSLVK